VGPTGRCLSADLQRITLEPEIAAIGFACDTLDELARSFSREAVGRWPCRQPLRASGHPDPYDRQPSDMSVIFHCLHVSRPPQVHRSVWIPRSATCTAPATVARLATWIMCREMGRAGRPDAPQSCHTPTGVARIARRDSTMATGGRRLHRQAARRSAAESG
jgi:hypothetical protein